MAIPYSKPHILPTQNPLSLLSFIFITFFLLLVSKVNSYETLSFNYNKFKPGDGALTLQGDASISSSGILELSNISKPGHNAGRALYATPVHLWDRSTGELASFVTSFSFVVRDYLNRVPADGIAFFLAPSGSTIPKNSFGGALGIIDISTAFNPVVAVEFDSFPNKWEPDYPHVGINVNTVTSLKTVKWERESGSLVKVSIIYDSLSKTLSVAVTYPNGQISTISQDINLKAVLPERVSIGFSASITHSRETHDIHSWSFTSTLQSSDTKKENPNIKSSA